MAEILVVIGTGALGQAIARRIGEGRKILLADVRMEAAESVAKTLRLSGFDVEPVTVDVTARASVQALADQASGLGSIRGLIHSAGVSPSGASPDTIFKVDLYGTAIVLEIFGPLMAKDSSGLVISSQAGHRLPAWSWDTKQSLATTPADDLLNLPILQSDQVAEPLVAYQYAKRGASLRVQAESVRWARNGARLNAISPGIFGSALSQGELNSSNRDSYQRMIEASAAKRTATADEIASLGAFLMGPEAQFISGSDFLIDGGVTAAYWWGTLGEEISS
ncbi:MAG: SDR family oxidoreductase [Wenzhouxiangella sp.]|jgi:NAD(P)-dependent dehydrogenase (short-subunit alcohol dehydrogenase family)|nr:SDR family oxidoreductase [Wenzhouxiangella sp.]